nr:hypothetical protein [Tanacetum cinerariifolium]
MCHKTTLASDTLIDFQLDFSVSIGETSISSEDPYEEAAQQLLEQAPCSPEYVPNPIDLEDHVPAHIPEHPEDLVPTEDEAPIEAYIPEMRAAVPSTCHSLLQSETPPLLPIPLPVPSTSCRAEISKADTPPRKRLLLTAPRPVCEVGESSAAAATRHPGPTMARSVDCSFIDIMETRFRDTKRRMMTALEMVNMRVSYLVDVRSRESSEFYSRHHDAQKDRTAVRAEIEVLRRERLAYEQESIQTRKALARYKAYSRALEARVAVLETQARRHEWQRQTADDFAKMAPKRTTRSTHVPSVTPALTTTTTTVTEAQLQALIDRGVAAVMAKAEASRVRNGYDSNGLGPRLAQAVRECTYPDFLKCQPFNFKGTEGVVRLTQWSRSYMVELPCEDCYSGSCSGIAVENLKENDDRQVLPKGRNQEARN